MTDRPNFLVIMSDEHGPMWSSVYGHPFVQTPNMERIAESGATFDAAYCNSPLCVPSRLSFMTGRYVSRCEGWDNAKPLPSDAPTWPYLLRSVGYDTALSGKMHLIGPDQFHGFRQQLAYDPHGGGQRDDAFVEHLAHGTDRPRAMVRQGRWKLSYSHNRESPDLELYNLETDPGEFDNLANDGRHTAVQQRLTARVLDIWGDPDTLDRRIKDSQRSRLMIRDVLGDQATF